MLPVTRGNRLFPSLVDEFFGRDFMPAKFDRREGVNVPSVNISETAEGFQIELAAPGLDKEDFNLSLANNILTITSEKEEKAETEEENKRIMRREFCYTTFSRAFSLPNSVDMEKIEASHRNGILYISIPKKDENKIKASKKIEIQ